MSQQVLERPALINNAEVAAKNYPPLTALDRCDARNLSLVEGKKTLVNCGAQAFVRAVMPSGRDLIFCGHCLGEQTVGRDAAGTKSETYATRRAGLLAQGAHFLSQYSTINLKPTDTSEPNGF